MAAAQGDQAAAAVADARKRVATALGIPDRPSPRGVSALFELLWSRHGDGPRCPHLDARPIQPWHLLPGEGTWRCRSCMRRWGQANRAPFDAVEEFTCDRCRRYIPSGPLEPTVVRQDYWVVFCGLCPRCLVQTVAEGAQVVSP